jgi:ion channel-forming bestrophin family protein
MIISKRLQLILMIQSLKWPLLVFVGWELLIVLLYEVLHWHWVGSMHAPLAFFGAAIGILLTFRNTSAYARWWEARTLWGAIVNWSRTLARQVLTSMSPKMAATDAEQAEIVAVQRELVIYQVAYVHALRQQLRGFDPVAAVAHLVPQEDPIGLAHQKNLALTLQSRMSETLTVARRRGWLDQWQWQAIDESLARLMDAQGGTERIKNTPMPKQYDFLLTFLVQIYCSALPMGIVETRGWFTLLGSTLVGFMFLAIDRIGREIEDPFENTVNDVPMTSITTTIEINLRQLLGETDLPSPEKPVDGVLW